MAVACAPRKLLREVDDKSETDKTPSMESRDTSPGSSSTKVDEEPDSDSIRSYPFPADVKLKFRESSINVIRHHCRQHPAGTKAIVLFLPGVHGGVGPCRKPGRDYDKNCLYAMVARRLQRKDAPVDIYRCSWPYMCPQMKNAIGGVCHALHCALIQAGVAFGEQQRDVKVILVGHSLGGAVALHTAMYMALHFGMDGLGSREVEGLEKASVKLAGLCTLNAAVNLEMLEERKDLLARMRLKALLVSGDADEVVWPAATVALSKVLPEARHLDLAGGTHDLYQHKEQLIKELSEFILACI